MTRYNPHRQETRKVATFWASFNNITKNKRTRRIRIPLKWPPTNFDKAVCFFLSPAGVGEKNAGPNEGARNHGSHGRTIEGNALRRLFQEAQLLGTLNNWTRSWAFVGKQMIFKRKLGFGVIDQWKRCFRDSQQIVLRKS